MPRPATKPILEPEAFAEIGEALFGHQWQSDLARAIGVTDRHVRFLADGTTAIGADIVTRLAVLCGERGGALKRHAKALQRAAGRRR